MMKRVPFAQDEAGTATIELALLVPILAAMLIGLIDLSTAYSDKLKLEQVAHRAIEKVQQTGFTVSKKAALEAEAVAAAGTGATATLTYWLECNGTAMTGSSAYTNGCSSGQSYARYVEIDVQKTYTPIIMSRFAGANANGTFTLHGEAGIRIQ
jgi:Flp pilus assembly protein TadG